jgi:hypothetical protein
MMFTRSRLIALAVFALVFLGAPSAVRFYTAADHSCLKFTAGLR